MEPELRRERARLAQRRSRAQRRRDHEGLQTRVQALETALENLTQSCLSFSDAVISAIKDENVSVLRDGIKPFMNRVLSISRDALDEGAVKDNDELEEVPPASRSNAVVASIRPQTRSPHTPGRLSPRLTYGLLPSLSPPNDAPLDALKYLSPQRCAGFAKALYWNTMVFATAVLELPRSPLWESLFFYPLRFHSLARVRNHVLRRVQCRPSDVEIVVPTAGRLATWTIDSSYATEDVEIEAHDRRKDLESIVQTMPTFYDDPNLYLEAAGVEQYLATRWGIGVDPGERSERDGRNISSPKGWNIANVERLISYLASRSRCLGDRVGFPIAAVDEVASGLFDVNFR